jgi:hypothetical protein
MSRIASRLDFNALSVVSINSVPSADVFHSVCALHMLKRGVAVMKKDIDLGLALLSVRMKPGEALTQEDIAAWCNRSSPIATWVELPCPPAVKRGWAPPFGGPTFPSSTRKKAKYCQ